MQRRRTGVKTLHGHFRRRDGNVLEVRRQETRRLQQTSGQKVIHCIQGVHGDLAKQQSAGIFPSCHTADNALDLREVDPVLAEPAPAEHAPRRR